MRYSYGSITMSSVNGGNSIIELATEQIAFPILGEPTRRFDSFCELPTDDPGDFVLLPGCTQLQPGQNVPLDRIPELRAPVYCLAGAFWARRGAGRLIRALVRGSVPIEWDLLRIARSLSGTIGARDPFTYAKLRRAGLRTSFTGCPTLFLEHDRPHEGGDYVLFSLGRERLRAQVSAARSLASRGHSVLVVAHELGQDRRCRAAGWDGPLVGWDGDSKRFLECFAQARSVITGRLHGALPALALGRPIFYFGARDSRTTLLDALGVPIHPYRDLTHAIERASPRYDREVAREQRERQRELLAEIHGAHA